MWIEPQIAVGALDDGHGAGFAGRQAALDMAPPIPSVYSVDEDAHHLSQQGSIERKGKSQRESDREHELS